MISRSIVIGVAVLGIAQTCHGLEIVLNGHISYGVRRTLDPAYPISKGDVAVFTVTLSNYRPSRSSDDLSGHVIRATAQLTGRIVGASGWVDIESHAASWLDDPGTIDIVLRNNADLPSPMLSGDVLALHNHQSWYLDILAYDAAGQLLRQDRRNHITLSIMSGRCDWFDVPHIDEIPTLVIMGNPSSTPPTLIGHYGNIIWDTIEFFHSAIPGDANRDGIFDRFDLVRVQQAGKYGTGKLATWSEGDWNADGYFDNRDLMVALAGSFPIAVPEASGLCLAIFAALFLLSDRLWFDRRWPGNA